MKIDIERLKVDRAYWDQVAPSGATHYYPPAEDWYRYHCGVFFFWSKSERFWCKAACPKRPEKSVAVSRPPENIKGEVEYDSDGNIPIGWHGECTWGYRGSWYECVMLPDGKIYHNTAFGWCVRCVDESYRWRPLNSEEKAKRESLKKLITSAGISNARSEHVIDNILSKCDVTLKEGL